MKNFNHLYYFYIVAKVKNMTSAAKILKTSQPSLSTQIKTLEINLNRSLFFKRGRFLELTAEGSRIYTYCAKMFHVYDELENYLSGVDVGEEINIGFSTEISRPFIADIVNQVLKKYKPHNRPKVKMDCESHEVLVDRLKTKKLDFILTNTFTDDYDLSIQRKFTMPIVLVGTNEFIKELGLKGVRKHDLILKKVSKHLALPSEHLKLRIETNAFFSSKRLNYKTVIESDILASIIHSTLEGIAFTLIPRPYIYKDLQNKQLKNLTPQSGLWDHNLFLVGRGDNSKNLFIKKLVTEIDNLI